MVETLAELPFIGDQVVCLSRERRSALPPERRHRRKYFPAGRYVLFSDIPNNRIMRYCEVDGHLSVFRQPSYRAFGPAHAGGDALDRHGTREAREPTITAL